MSVCVSDLVSLDIGDSNGVIRVVNDFSGSTAVDILLVPGGTQSVATITIRGDDEQSRSTFPRPVL